MSAFTPYPYQTYAIERIVNEEHVGLLLDMGLGKTVITLTALRELIYDQLAVSRALVIAPKKVAEATWQAEAKKWDHLRDLRISTCMGTPGQRIMALEGRSDIVVTNRDNVVWLEEQLNDPSIRSKGFDMVIVDESSSFKNPSSKRFKALRRMLRWMKRVVILTGTPAPNGLEDLWAQIYLLDRGERLERYITHYRVRYFDYNPWRHAFTPKPGAFEAVREKISDICVSMSAADYLMLPERIVHDIPVVLDENARRAYRKLEREMLLELNEDETITALSAASLTNKLLQLCGGSVYDAQGNDHEVHDAKLEALSELVESLNGESCLVFYGFRHEIPRILASLPRGARVRQLDGAADADAWNRGDVDVLLAHPASCAYGLNLQMGGRHIVWYTLPWSLELYQQANARLWRQGQTKPVVIHRLLVQGGVDEDVAKALEGKADVQGALLEALKRRADVELRIEN